MQNENVVTLMGQYDNGHAELNALQEMLAPYTYEMSVFWWFAWFVTLFAVIRYAYRHGVYKDSGDRNLYTD
jgi:hypothetical protein